jgi:hypothetical protein
MNAEEAFKISKQNWADNEKEYLVTVIGFQTKVETAAKEGRTNCNVAVIPRKPAIMDFTASFFEQQGYWVGFQPLPSGEIAVSVGWKQEPMGSRAFNESKEFAKSIE